MTVNEKKVLVVGLGPVYAVRTPIYVTRSGALAWGKRKAARMNPKGFWAPSVFEGEDCFRVSFGGQPEKRS